MPTTEISDPRMLAFLPAVYVAWADGELTPEEVAGICRRIDSAPGLDSDCRSVLGAWLERREPPTAEELSGLLETIRTAAGSLDSNRERTLSQLGVELAAAHARDLAEPELRALAALEEALGVDGLEVGRALLAPPRPAATETALAPPPFDVAMLARWLDGEQGPVRSRVRALLATPELTPPSEPTREEYRVWVFAACRHLADEGLGALAFPLGAGGEDDLAGSVAAFETLAAGDLSVLVKFGVQFGLWGGSVLRLGSEHHHRELLPRIGSLELPGCFAMTESGHGSNVADLETVALFDVESDEFVLHTPNPEARKDYIGNAALDGRMATVFARLRIGTTDHGIHAFVVPIRDDAGSPMPAVRIEDCGAKMGLDGVDNGRLWFDGVRVPRSALLDRFASVARNGCYTSSIADPGRRFFTMLGTLVGGRVSVALAAVTAAKKALTIAIRYNTRRRQFGPAGHPEQVVLDYLTQQRRLLVPLAATYAYHFAGRALAARYTGGDFESDPEVEILAAGVKALATWHATATIQAGREACGGWGYLAENGFARLKADTDVFTTFEGDNMVLLQLVAKQRLSGLRKQFGRLDALGFVRLFAARIESAVVERNPFAIRDNDDDHLLDRDFHRAAFARRSSHLLETLARRLRSRIRRGLDPFDALVECQDHAVEAARASTEDFVLEEFSHAVDSAPDEYAPTLSLLCDLYALSVLERERAWFLEHGDFAPEKSKAVAYLVSRLCRRVRPLAPALVEAFSMPQPLD